VKWLDESRFQRLELMDDLRDGGLMYYQIAELLNLKGIKTPTNKEYTSKLVERSLFKHRNRLKRHTDIEVLSVKEDYHIGVDNLKLD
jgi:hypothetical protein